jgi:hypothetical protein
VEHANEQVIVNLPPLNFYKNMIVLLKCDLTRENQTLAKEVVKTVSFNHV